MTWSWKPGGNGNGILPRPELRVIVPVAVILDVVNELPGTCVVCSLNWPPIVEPPSGRAGEGQGVIVGVEEGIQSAAAVRELLRVLRAGIGMEQAGVQLDRAESQGVIALAEVARVSRILVGLDGVEPGAVARKETLLS